MTYEQIPVTTLASGFELFIPLHRLTYWRQRPEIAAAHLPQADAAFARSVSLPLFTAMSDLDIDYVVAAVRRLLA